MLLVWRAVVGSMPTTCTGLAGVLASESLRRPFSSRKGLAATTPGVARIRASVAAVSGISPSRWATVKGAVAVKRLRSISFWKPFPMAMPTTMAKTPRATPKRAKRTMMRTKAPFFRVRR